MAALPVYQIVFFSFAAILLFASVMVITSRHPVRAVLFLILAFFAAAVLWLMIQAEFLALVLIFVYVGAVMTLFLFIVMMLNIQSVKSEGFVKYIPFAVLVVVLFIAVIVTAFMRAHVGAGAELVNRPETYSNVKELGVLLYTNYLYPLEITGAILLASIVSAIVLAFHGRKFGTKSQNISHQHLASKETSMRIVKMKVEKP